MGANIVDEVIKDLYRHGLKSGEKLFFAGSRYVLVSNHKVEGCGIVLANFKIILGRNYYFGILYYKNIIYFIMYSCDSRISQSLLVSHSHYQLVTVTIS